jgi:hypothetical protein
MSVFRLPSGGNLSRGYAANFKQDVVFIREIPLTTSQLPCLVIKRRGVDNSYAEFKVCRKRVEEVGRFLIQHHPGFASHRITFSQTNRDLLPEDGLLSHIPTMDADHEDLVVTEEGAMTRDVPPEDNLDQPQPPNVAFVITNNIRPPQQNEILHALDPVKLPTISPQPINKFDVMSGLASLLFIKLFPLGQADPTKKGHRKDLSELIASNHLMKYTENDCTKEPDDVHPNEYLCYPFAEHRFCFWMVDRIRRHRALAQCSVFLKQNPEEAALSKEELKAMAANGQLDSVIGKMYSYTANVTGSDAYWNKRRRELEAIM